MSPEDQKNWKDGVLAELLKAIVADTQLREALIFKGARILNRHLQTQRQSLDIDSNLTIEFLQKHADREERATWFEEHFARAFRSYFEDQDPVRYEVERVSVRNSPAQSPHRHGWDGLIAEIRISDMSLTGVKALPTLELDIAAPESLGDEAVCELSLDNTTIRAYALHRIAGEKLRAFLTSLPTYRKKVSTKETHARAKDLYDLTRILEARPINQEGFWVQVSDEFRLACESRYVDCAGLATFQEEIQQTKQTYETDPTLKEIPWEKALSSLQEIVNFFESNDVFPMDFPIPEDNSKTE